MRVGLAIAAVALLAIGVLTKSWWTFEEMGIAMRIGLRKLAVCGGGACVEVGHTQVGGVGTAFRFFAFVTYFGGLLAATGLAVGVFVRETQDNDAIARSAGSACGLVAVASVLTMISFPEMPKFDMPGGRGFDLSLSYGFYFTLIGGIAGAISGWAGLVSRVWEGKTYVPLGGGDIGAEPTAAGGARHPGAGQSLAPRSALASAERNREHLAQMTAQAGALREHEKQRRDPKRADQRQGDVANAATDTLRTSLRFVARTCEINPLGMTAVLESGKQRDVLWSDVGVIVARVLPPDPPFEKTTFIDIVPAPFPGRPPSPIRLLPSTRANYGALPGGAGTTSKENFRKLAAFVEQSKPGVIDGDSAGFFRQGTAAPLFASLDQFTRYDAQFAD